MPCQKARAWVAERVAGLDLCPPDESSLPPLPGLGPPLDLDTLPEILAAAPRWGEEWATSAWAGRHGTMPNEAEGLALVTVRLLLPLGWPRDQIALNWKYTDIALFSEPYRSPETCRVIIEGKGLNDGLRWARD